MRRSKGLTASVLGLFLVVTLAGQTFGAIIHVSNGKWLPGYWQCPTPNITLALATAVSGDEIWVARGTYVERITLKTGVALYGGFEGNETSRDQRDWNAHPTIIDGNQVGRVVTAQSVSNVTIDGFTIRNGRSSDGGGIYAYATAPLVVCNCTVTGNTAINGGGGISCTTGSVSITNSVIAANAGAKFGGGVFCNNMTAVALSGNVVRRNTAEYGGGIYLEATQDQYIVSNNTIDNNTANYYGGGIYAKRAIYSDSALTLLNNLVKSNIAQRAAGIYFELVTATVSGNVIASNAASSNGGGGLHACNNSSCTITNNTFTENRRNGQATGAAIWLDFSPSTISNNIIAFNTSGVYSANHTAALKNNDVYNPSGANYAGSYTSTGDISADPKFVGPAGWDYRIQPDSPCVDAGWNDASSIGSVDIDGQPRVQPFGGTVDIGADECDGITRVAPTPVIVRVDGISGNDLNDGSTWGLAKKTVQSGLDAASAAGGEVWVKAGIYHGQFIMRSHAGLYGGFAGTETTRDARSWAANLTILDGDSVNTTISAIGCSFSAIDGFTIRNGKSNSSGGGIRCETSSISISNNTICGNAGGGIGLGYSTATVSNNVIKSNAGYDGGGIYAFASAAIISNNTIIANSASRGGGMSCTQAGTSSAISNNIIVYNSSGIYQNGSAPTLRNNDVYNPAGANYTGISAGVGDISADPKCGPDGDLCLTASSPCRDAGWNGAAGVGSVDIAGKARVFPAGGTVDMGAYEWDGTASPVIRPVIRVDGAIGSDENDGTSWAAAKGTIQSAIDMAAVVGGDVWVKAGTYIGQISLKPFTFLYGGFAGTETSRGARNPVANVTTLDGNAASSVVVASNIGPGMATIDGFTIQNGKTTGDGGGINCSYFGGTISHNTIKANTAANGGGISSIYSAATISGNVIASNTATYNGGGIRCAYLGSAPNTITNNTIVDNASGSAPGAGVSSSSLVASLAGNLIAFNSSGIAGKFVSLRNNDVYNPGRSNYLGTSPGIGDISLDPLFASKAGGDYHLSASSPCIDLGLSDAAGIPATDLDGEARLNGIADIGADEYWAGTARTIRDAKAAAAGAAIDIYGGIVTAAFADSFYIESDDRVSGVLVKKPGHSLQLGNRAHVVGSFPDPCDPERYIQASAADATGTGSLAPFALANSLVGGGTCGAQAGVWGWTCTAGTSGQTTRTWDQVKGLNNIGLLITTYGRVTGIEPVEAPANPTWFTIDDGSGTNLKCVVPDGVTIDPAWQYVRVTGISSCERVGAELHALVKVRKQDDILTF